MALTATIAGQPRGATMTFYANLKISTKILSLLGLLGLFVVTATVFTTLKMSGIDQTYSALLSNDAKGAVMMMKLNARLLDTGRMMFMLIAETDTEKLQKIDKDISADVDKIHDYMKTTRVLLPKRSGELDEMERGFDALIAGAADIRAKALVNNNAEAMRLMRDRFEPGLATLRAAMNALAQTTQDNLDKASDAASSSSGR